jgi:hypothetical protein
MDVFQSALKLLRRQWWLTSLNDSSGGIGLCGEVRVEVIKMASLIKNNQSIVPKVGKPVFRF